MEVVYFVRVFVEWKNGKKKTYEYSVTKYEN